MPKLRKKAIRYGLTYGRTDPNYRKASLLKSKKSTCLKLTYGHFGNYYRVATLSKSYLTTKGITMHNLKSIGQF